MGVNKMRPLVLLMFMLPSVSFAYTADFRNPFIYCESSQGLGDLTYGDADRMIGLRDGNTYSQQFVEGLRERLMRDRCMSLSDYIEQAAQRQPDCVLGREHFTAQEIHRLQCREAKLEDCFDLGEKGLEIFVNDTRYEYESKCDSSDD